MTSRRRWKSFIFACIHRALLKKVKSLLDNSHAFLCLVKIGVYGRMYDILPIIFTCFKYDLTRPQMLKKTPAALYELFGSNELVSSRFVINFRWLRKTFYFGYIVLIHICLYIYMITASWKAINHLLFLVKSLQLFNEYWRFIKNYNLS